MTNGHDYVPVTGPDDLRCVHCDSKPGYRAADVPCEYSPVLDALEQDELTDKKAALASMLERRFG